MAKSTAATKSTGNRKKSAATPHVVKSPPTQPVGLEKYDFQVLLGDYGTKSAVIRFLSSEGLSRSDIAKVTGLRYQHVRNVLLMPIGKQAAETT